MSLVLSSVDLPCPSNRVSVRGVTELEPPMNIGAELYCHSVIDVFIRGISR